MTLKAKELFVHLLVLGFGTGAWVAVNGVWMELPLLVNSLPEGWNLPSYMTIILTLGNIGPICVALFQGRCKSRYHGSVAIYIIILMAIAASFALCFVWDQTVVIAGTACSLPFLSLWYILSMVDCTSSVTFLPFMANFQSLFLTTYFIGEGLSSLFPSVMALIQSVGTIKECVNVTNSQTNKTKLYPVYNDPNFTVDGYFGFLTVMMTFCGVSFLLLDKSKKISPFKNNDSSSIDSQNNVESEERQKLNPNYEAGTSSSIIRIISPMLVGGDYVFFFFLIFWMNCLTNGVLPSVSPFTSLPYGESAYHIALALGNIANPCACVIAYFYPLTTKRSIGLSSFIGTLFGCYLLILAIQSPCPILVSKTTGAFLMVFSQVMFIGLLSYVKLCIAKVFRDRGSENCLVWYGATVQVGSIVGAVVMFVCVTVEKLFVPGDPCVNLCDL